MPQISDRDAGVLFIRRLAEDTAIGPNDPQTMEDLIKGLFTNDDGELNESPTAAEADAVASKIINSLKVLDRESGDRTPAEQAEWNKATGMIRAIFADPDGDGDVSNNTPTKIAQALQSYHETELQKPAAARDDFWTLFGNSGADFAVTLNDSDMSNLTAMLNRLAPGLGNLLVPFVAGFAGAQNGPIGQEAQVHNEIAQSFGLMLNGGGNELAAFWGREPVQDADGNDVSFNSWSGTGGNPDYQRAFFTPEGMPGANGRPGTHKFYDSDAPGSEKPMSFQHLILDRWESDEDGHTPLVIFATDADRQEFIQYAQQITMGGMLGANYVATLQDSIVDRVGAGLTFQAGDVNTPGSEAHFAEFLKGLDTRNTMHVNAQGDRISREEHISNQVADYIADNGVTLPPGADLGFVKSLAEDTAQFYTPAASANEFALLVREYAARTPGMTVNVPGNEPYTGPTVADAIGSGTVSPTMSLEGVADVSTAVRVTVREDGSASFMRGSNPIDAFKFAGEFDLYKAEVVDANGNGKGEITLEEVEDPGEDGSWTVAELLEKHGENGFMISEVSHHGTDTIIGYKIEVDGEEYFLGANALTEQGDDFKERNRESRHDDAAAPNTVHTPSEDPSYQAPTLG